MAKKPSIATEIGSALGAAAARAEQLISSKPATKTTKPTAKRTTAAKHSVNTSKKTAKVEEAETTPELETAQTAPIEIDLKEIEIQAYLYWESRGFHGGNPAEDWARAEEAVKQRAGKTKSASA